MEAVQAVAVALANQCLYTKQDQKHQVLELWNCILYRAPVGGLSILGLRAKVMEGSPLPHLFWGVVIPFNFFFLGGCLLSQGGKT